MAGTVAAADTINPAVSYTLTSTLTDTNPFTLGYEFTTSTTFDVNALGYWDDGLGNNHQVGLWTSTGTLLTSATVSGTDAITDNFRYHMIADFILAPGTYVIGGEFLGNGDSFPDEAQGVTSIPGYTWVTDEQQFGSGLNFPTTSTGGGYGDNGILVVDFSVTGGAPPVPEPGSVMLLGTGVACLVSKLRKKLVKAYQRGRTRGGNAAPFHISRDLPYKLCVSADTSTAI
jgi:hypothetical protein